MSIQAICPKCNEARDISNAIIQHGYCPICNSTWPYITIMNNWLFCSKCAITYECTHPIEYYFVCNKCKIVQLVKDYARYTSYERPSVLQLSAQPVFVQIFRIWYDMITRFFDFNDPDPMKLIDDIISKIPMMPIMFNEDWYDKVTLQQQSLPHIICHDVYNCDPIVSRALLETNYQMHMEWFSKICDKMWYAKPDTSKVLNKFPTHNQNDNALANTIFTNWNGKANAVRQKYIYDKNYPDVVSKRNLNEMVFHMYLRVYRYLQVYLSTYVYHNFHIPFIERVTHEVTGYGEISRESMHNVFDSLFRIPGNIYMSLVWPKALYSKPFTILYDICNAILGYQTLPYNTLMYTYKHAYEYRDKSYPLENNVVIDVAPEVNHTKHIVQLSIVELDHFSIPLEDNSSEIDLLKKQLSNVIAERDYNRARVVELSSIILNIHSALDS